MLGQEGCLGGSAFLCVFALKLKLLHKVKYIQFARHGTTARTRLTDVGENRHVEGAPTWKPSPCLLGMNSSFKAKVSP